MAIPEIKDHRALAFPDEPYSAYCKVCWYPIYTVWIDREDHHNGECPEGHLRADECENARARMETRRVLEQLKRDGLLADPTQPPAPEGE